MLKRRGPLLHKKERILATDWLYLALNFPTYRRNYLVIQTSFYTKNFRTPDFTTQKISEWSLSPVICITLESVILCSLLTDVAKMKNEEWRTGNGERGTGVAEWGFWRKLSYMWTGLCRFNVWTNPNPNRLNLLRFTKASSIYFPIRSIWTFINRAGIRHFGCQKTYWSTLDCSSSADRRSRM